MVDLEEKTTHLVVTSGIVKDWRNSRPVRSEVWRFGYTPRSEIVGYTGREYGLGIYETEDKRVLLQCNGGWDHVRKSPDSWIRTVNELFGRYLSQVDKVIVNIPNMSGIDNCFENGINNIQAKVGKGKISDIVASRRQFDVRRTQKLANEIGANVIWYDSSYGDTQILFDIMDGLVGEHYHYEMDLIKQEEVKKVIVIDPRYW